MGSSRNLLAGGGRRDIYTYNESYYPGWVSLCTYIVYVPLSLPYPQLPRAPLTAPAATPAANSMAPGARLAAPTCRCAEGGAIGGEEGITAVRAWEGVLGSRAVRLAGRAKEEPELAEPTSLAIASVESGGETAAEER